MQMFLLRKGYTMKLGFTTCNINPVFPVKRFSGRFGDEKYEIPVKGDLICPILYTETNDAIWIHVSLANPDIEIEGRNHLKTMIETALNKDVIFTICGTHTHYTPNINTDIEYQIYVGEQIISALKNMDVKDYSDLSYSFTREYYDEVGRSRITGLEVKNLYLNVLSLYSENKRIASFIVYNCHASTMSMRKDIFTSAGPGVLLKELSEKYPGEFFTYMCGAAGDVSTRFSRNGQEYEDMLEMAYKVVDKTQSILDAEKEKIPFDDIEVSEIMLPVKREYVDLSKYEIPEGLSQREKETIELDKKESKDRNIPAEKLPAEILFQKAKIGDVTMIFTPFEMFSEYIDYIDKKHAVIVNLANDRICYLSGLNQKVMSFELFGESIARDSKEEIAQLLKKWSHEV